MKIRVRRVTEFCSPFVLFDSSQWVNQVQIELELQEDVTGRESENQFNS